jgi:sialic acid synthase SpsE
MKVKYIAEVSSNHNCDIERSKQFIDVSREAGCDGVKFQLFKISELFAPEILNKSEKHRNREKWELPEDFIPILADYTHQKGLLFSCTPFYLEAVNILEPYVDFYKIASYELLWLDLFKKCGETGKPVVFSTGMAIMGEVEKALKTLIDSGCREITILHCNSSYPTPIEDANLGAITELHKMVNSLEKPKNTMISIGYSDHTVSPVVLERAIQYYGSEFIEFHMDIDGQGEEYSAGHCWLPDEIAEVINRVHMGCLADGTGKFAPSPSELPDREWRADPLDGLRPLISVRKNYDG